MKPLQNYTGFINCMLHAVVQILKINGDFRGFAETLVFKIEITVSILVRYYV